MIGENAVGDYSSPKRALPKLALMMAIPVMIMGVNVLVDVIHITELGPDAVSAISISLPVYWIMMVATTVLSGMLQKKVRAALEKGDREGAETVTSDAMYLGIGVAFIFSILAFFASQVLVGMFLDDKISDLAGDYLSPFFLLFFAFPSFAIVTGLFSAEGSYRRYTLMILLVVTQNIVLDMIFMHELHMGVFGNGLGTVLGIYVGAVTGLVLYRRKSGRMMLRLKRPDLHRIIELGWEVGKAAIIPLGEAGVKYAAMFAIVACTTVYATIYYTIPMHIVSVLASAGSAVAMASAVISEKMPDSDEKIKFWTFSYKYLLIVSVAMVVLSQLIMEVLVDNLIHFEDRQDWKEFMMYSTAVLSLAIPFMGLRHMNDHVFEKITRNNLGKKIMLCSIIIRIITYVIAAMWLEYPAIYYVVTIDYALAGTAGTAIVWWLQKNRRDLIFGDASRDRTGP